MLDARFAPRTGLPGDVRTMASLDITLLVLAGFDLGS